MSEDGHLVYTFTASSPQDKEEWVNSITEALRRLGSIVISKLTYDPIEKIKEETRARRESLGGH